MSGSSSGSWHCARPGFREVDGCRGTNARSDASLASVTYLLGAGFDSRLADQMGTSRSDAIQCDASAEIEKEGKDDDDPAYRLPTRGLLVLP